MLKVYKKCWTCIQKMLNLYFKNVIKHLNKVECLYIKNVDHVVKMLYAYNKYVNHVLKNVNIVF